MVIQKIVFLDRDGILTIPKKSNGKGYAPQSMKEVFFYPDTETALNQLHEQGFKLIIVSNQPDISTGKISEEFVLETHELIRERFPILDILFCPHNRTQKCRCRKPDVGLFEEALRKWNLSTDRGWMIGDRDSDIEAGIKFGLSTVFLDRGWKEEFGKNANFQAKSLTEATQIIVDNWAN